MSNPTTPAPAATRTPSPFGAAAIDVPAADRRGGARVVVQGLTKEFVHGGVLIPVLRGLTFELRPGEIASVVGASGVGKSTLLQVLGTLDTPTAGTITFDGVDVTSMSAARVAEFRNREIGFVFQFHHLLPEFTALENAMMPGLIMRLPRAACAERAAAILARLGLGHRLTHRPGELSGGEQQRVALGRALLLRPRLLLADEPTGNLDMKTGREMHELFFELSSELGTTILIVTHNDELAARTPRRMRMADGLIVEGA
ncbi:MAG TPA: ATP-binding cassette domain-containing protein [Polyangia bacterium]|nr:ATP-binding cassette domain-containing protein [Polyangia bacterium]